MANGKNNPKKNKSRSFVQNAYKDVRDFLDRERERYLNYTEGYDKTMRNRKYKHPSERDGSPEYALGGWINDQLGLKDSSFLGKATDVVGDYATSVADTTMGLVGAGDVIQKDDYETKEFGKFSDVMSQDVAPIAGKIGATALGGPLGGAAMGAVQQGVGQVTPDAEQQQAQQQRQQMIQRQRGVRNMPNQQASSQYTSPYMMPLGGMVPYGAGSDVELEKGETYRTPAGVIKKVPDGAPTHSNGGQDMTLPVGTEVLGKLKNSKDKRYKDLGRRLERAYNNYKKVIEGNPTPIAKRTAEMNLRNVQKEYSKLMAEQENKKSNKNSKKYQTGGTTLGPGKDEPTNIDPVIVTADRPVSYENFSPFSTWATELKRAADRGEDVSNVPIGSITGDTNMQRLNEEDIVRWGDIDNIPPEVQSEYGFDKVKFAKGGQVMQEGGEAGYIDPNTGYINLPDGTQIAPNIGGYTDRGPWAFDQMPNYRGYNVDFGLTPGMGGNQQSGDMGQFGLLGLGDISASPINQVPGSQQQTSPNNQQQSQLQGNTQQLSFPNRGRDMQRMSGAEFAGMDTGGVDTQTLASPDAELMAADMQTGTQGENQLGGTNAPGGGGGFNMGNMGNVGTALGTAAQFAPALYNLGRGLFGETADTELDYRPNPYKQQVLNLMGDRRYNVQPQLRSAERASRIAERNLRETGASPAQYLANMSGVQAQRQQGISKALAQKQNMDNQYRQQQAQMMQQMGSQEARRRQQLANQNLQRRLSAQAAQDRMVSQGLSQLGASSRGLMQDMQNRRNTQQLIGGWNKYLQGANISDRGLSVTPQMMDLFSLGQ